MLGANLFAFIDKILLSLIVTVTPKLTAELLN